MKETKKKETKKYLKWSWKEDICRQHGIKHTYEDVPPLQH